MAALPSSVPGMLARHLDAFEEALRTAIGTSDRPLPAAARYVLGWEDADGRPAENRGKRIRPLLTLLAAEIVGGDARVAMPGAVAVELVHNFSLVHDEVQDHDAERHHRPTIWALMGEGQAINVGDYLYARAVEALAGGEDNIERRMRALRVLNQAIERMIGGQWSDISFERCTDVTVEEYLAMVAGKTGALLGAPLEMGALLAGAEPATAASIGEWGREVGLAFQVQDDYLGIWGDTEATGKSTSNDIARRKKTYPVLFGLAQARSRPAILGAYESNVPQLTEAQIAEVVAALESVGADAATREEAHRHVTNADALLSALPLDEDRRVQLREIAAFLVERSG